MQSFLIRAIDVTTVKVTRCSSVKITQQAMLEIFPTNA